MSDEDIIGKVRKNNPDKLINVENRINTFLDFMKNIEKGILVERTLETGINEIEKNNFIDEIQIDFKKTCQEIS